MQKQDMWRAILAVAAIALVIGAWKAGANNAMLAPDKPPVIALVNLERVLQNLEELDARGEELDAFRNERVQRLEEINRNLQDATTRLEILAQGTPDYARQEEQVAMLQMTLRFQSEVAQERIDRRKGELHTQMFNKVLDAVNRMAKQRNIDLVLSHDGEISIAPGGEAQVTRQIAMRRILYAGNAIEVSDEVLQLMNNEWRAGAGGGQGGRRN